MTGPSPTPLPDTPRILQVVDLAFGDSGKGTIVDWLCRRRAGAMVVRFNGGPQAGHNVVTPDGRHHTFSQLGSGSFVPGVATLLSRYMLIEPYALLNEARHLQDVGVTDALDRLTIDADCPVITPAHQAANRLRELARGTAAHGTCGMGVGELMQDLQSASVEVLRAGELHDPNTVRRKLLAACERKRQTVVPLVAAAPRQDQRVHRSMQTIVEPTWIDAAVDVYAEVAATARISTSKGIGVLLRHAATLVFEGAQGVLLDETYGFHPHTTWSTTTFANADQLLDEHGVGGKRFRVGVIRAYFTRHGVGPFVTDDPALRRAMPEHHNHDAGWQGAFRVGPFDTVAARYSIEAAGGIDGLAVTHLDRLPITGGRVCTAYTRDGTTMPLRHDPQPSPAGQEALTRCLYRCSPAYEAWPVDPDAFCRRLESSLGVAVTVKSCGPTAAEKTSTLV